MAATFRPVNSPLAPADTPIEETMASPMTPRPSTAPSQTPRPMDDATTPTRASFGNSALASQKPLPTSPFPESVQVPESSESKVPTRENSQRSRQSKDSDEMDMDESDDEAGDDAGGSDEETVNADGTKSKKKKSQRFYCTDYPPCNLSFTRSEHLARHIRKHTGERPFQCHCSRRFSRLDNLRQHAQTVHVNEDIPIDSLAATGTRFQRQIRTERVRQAGGRARAATAGSVGPVGRGHSKSLSTSSVASISSISSAYSANEARRRPPPLVMADPRSRLSLETYRSIDPSAPYYRPPSPSDFSTPTSATFSTGQNSPRWGSGVASPSSSHSRSHSMYAGSRTPGRRLSVPSGGNPFQSPHGTSVRGPLFGLGGPNASNNGAFSPSQGNLMSPTGSTSTWSRRDSMSSAADEAWRRRTWHPDTRDYNGTSRLNQVITPSQFPPARVSLPVANQGNQPQQTLRLPGIESFDPIPRPMTPPRRNPSPMMIDSDPSRGVPGSDMGDDRRNMASHWDMGLHRGLTRLDINTPPKDSAGAWANEVNQAVLAQADQARAAPIQQSVRFDAEVKTVQPPTSMPPSSNAPMQGSRHHYTMSAPSISTPRESRRHGWYHGPVTVHPAGETIHEGRPPHVDRIVHPNVSSFQGFPNRDRDHPPVSHQQPGPGMERILERPHPTGNSDNMRRLEALVAVATSEGSTATAY
ncbi:Biofilm and cell wall regulator 1 [Rhypophila decipiens]|uniref:Biofilm and cell wall regulator 1 n=1 Tax=Rhypophila decipiens TaxID=261697 RepID=A0AAN6Y119_9PEZI|nr:Biofilm and cell wall regulator 1 [Rhypophila decipiens]